MRQSSSWRFSELAIGVAPESRALARTARLRFGGRVWQFKELSA
jgi:hypothetical protein